MSASVIVVGLGEIGKPLMELISTKYQVLGIDIEPVEYAGDCDVMHVCYPFGINDFLGQTIAYIKKYKPRVTVINSTVAPGTTRAIYEATNSAIVNSPVRGKHIKMKQDLLFYTKFIGGIREEYSQWVAEHFNAIGMKTKILS